ncbi:hypothetical protein [uncultured Mediterranean phage]|nr:hypothetical protein [uncultured Mediterranean phage]
MVEPAVSEFRVRVTLDGRAAERGMKDMENKTKKSFARTLGVVTAGLGFLFGGLAKEGTGIALGFGDIVGRQIIGPNTGQFLAEQGANLSARQRTAEALGIAGGASSKEEILALFKAFKTIETLEATGKRRVLDVTGGEIIGGDTTSQIIDALRPFLGIAGNIEKLLQLIVGRSSPELR